MYRYILDSIYKAGCEIMKKYLNINNWNRKEHFEFFSTFDDPFFGIVDEIDITQAQNMCKEKNIPFFIYYHFQAIKAINKIDEFRYRIEDEKVVIFDTIHVTTTLARVDNTFAFSFIPFTESFNEFTKNAKKVIESIKSSKGLGLNENTSRMDTIHFSTLPWISFKGVTHARNFKYPDSTPKITFGKFFNKENKVLMPIAVNAHHGLMDAFHVAQYLKIFQEFLNKTTL